MYVADLIRNGSDDSTLQQWKQVMLNVSMRVEVTTGYEQRFWKSVNLRQRYAGTYDALTRSTIQQIYELVKFRDEFQPGTRREIAEAWQAKVTDLGTMVIEGVDFSFVDSAIKIHDRMLCYPDAFNAIQKMEMEFGKASCLNYIRVLEVICMKGKEPEQLWILNTILDYIFQLKEINNRDLSTRALQGTSSTRGLLDVFLTKRKMMLWITDHLASKNVPPEWIDVMKDLQTHAQFRSKVGVSSRGGDGSEQPDQSWLGTEHEVIRLAVDILKKVVYGAFHDHTLKNLLKGSSAPADLFAKEPFSDMMKDLNAALDAHIHKSKKNEEEVVAPTVAKDYLTTFLPDGVEHCPEDLEEDFSSHILEAGDLVDRFVKFIPECSSKSELAQALDGTAVSKKQPDGTTALVVMDTKNKEQFDEGEMCLLLDGSRQISTSMMSCFVRDDGAHFENKTRLYGGSNMSTSIGPVVLEPVENMWLVPAEKKKIYEGGNAKVLAGGGLPDAPAKPQLSGEPMTYHAMPVKFYRELLHSFCAGVVFFVCDPDGVGAMAAVLAKVPCVVLVYTAEHGAALRARLTEFVVNQFQLQSSPIYRNGEKNQKRKDDGESGERNQTTKKAKTDIIDALIKMQDDKDEEEADGRNAVVTVMKAFPLTFGSACSGICSELFAAEMLGLEVRPVFACDCNQHVTKVSQHLWSHEQYFNNVFDKEFLRDAPTVDFFLGGFPCQPFSLQGLGQGVADEANGTVIYELLKYIKERQPTTFVLENVKGLLTQHPQVLMEIMKHLRGLKVTGTRKPLYTVLCKCLNARNHGLPQNRERIVVIGMLNAKKTYDFAWPMSVEMQPLTRFINDKDVGDESDLNSLNKTELNNLHESYQKIRAGGGKPTQGFYVVNLGGTSSHYNLGYLPCLTRSRCGSRGYWLSWLKRKITAKEMWALQGLPKKVYPKDVVTETQLGYIVGNAIPIPLLANVMSSMFDACPLH
ncbi:unnamed protein product [Effrenium voratum]|uniref:Cytosine-specific methyltransferase n=1 Tax=Effrenium voratum TaxID=2562239 RepID=A0AA36N0F5_9DINO|nr:unnamed protein product [Effrenium voratum]